MASRRVALADLADRDRDRAVGDPAVLGHAHVDREHVAALQRVRVGDAVHHHRVRRGADRAREAAIALEGRRRPLRADEALGRLVELGVVTPGRHLAAQHLEAARVDLAGRRHRLDLLGGLQDDPAPVHQA